MFPQLFSEQEDTVITTNTFRYYWQKMKAILLGKVDKVEGKGLSSNDYTAAEKAKLAGIADGANKFVHPTHTAKDAGLYKVTVDGMGHVTGAAAVTKGDITGLGIPGQDTTYNDATTSAPGLMTAADKTKLDGVETGANKFVHPTHTAKAAGLYKVTVDGMGHVTGAAAVTKDDITGLGIPGQDTTYSDATTSAHGLMTAADKTKLNAVPTPSTIATQTYVAQQVAAAGHVKKSIVDALPTVAAADGNTIYMVAKTAGEAGNGYDEYMVIEGAWEKIGDTQTTLKMATNADIDAILAS